MTGVAGFTPVGHNPCKHGEWQGREAAYAVLGKQLECEVSGGTFGPMQMGDGDHMQGLMAFHIIVITLSQFTVGGNN